MKDDDLMPFGKFKGQKLIEVPSWHLKWVGNNIREKAPNKRNLTEKLLLKYIDENNKTI